MLCITMLMTTNSTPLQAKLSFSSHQLFDDESSEESEEPEDPCAPNDPNPHKTPFGKISISYDSAIQTILVLFREKASVAQITILHNSCPIIVDMFYKVTAGTIIPYSIFGYGNGCYTIKITINGSTYTVEIQI